MLLRLKTQRKKHTGLLGGETVNRATESDRTVQVKTKEKRKQGVLEATNECLGHEGWARPLRCMKFPKQVEKQKCPE